MIKLDRLDKYYNRNGSNEIHVINDVSLELPNNGMVAVFGRSGCGKTTLLNVIGGLDKFSGGTVTIDGNDITLDTDVLRNLYVGYVFQNYNLNAGETVAENVADALRLLGARDENEIDARVSAALKAVDMNRYAKRTPDTLSGGQQQRVAIARAIVKNPRVILADEPTGNLDEANTVMVMDLLHKIARDHLVVLVTHEENLVDHYCNMVVELEDGKIVSVRENERVNGYAVKDKNAVYLGEFERSERVDEIVSLEYYGEKPEQPIKLKIVNVKGKTYIRIDSENVRCLDETGELRLVEGVFDGEKEIEEKLEETKEELPPIKIGDNARIGRLFSFKSSLKSGREVYLKNKIRGQRFLRILMILFAFIATFMTSVSATSFRDLNSIASSYDHNVFYVSSENATLSALSPSDENAIDYNPMVGYSSAYMGGNSLFLSLGAFETYSGSNSSYVFATLLDSSLSASMTAVAGKSIPESGEIVLTTTVVDNLINNLKLPYLSDYYSFLGLTMSKDAQYFGISRNKNVSYSIVGVVASGERSMYLSAQDLAIFAADENYLAVLPASVLPESLGISVSDGNAAYLTFTNDSFSFLSEEPQDIDSVKIFGKTFSVTTYDKRGDDDFTAAFNESSRFDYRDDHVFLVSDNDMRSLFSDYGETDDVAYKSGVVNSYSGEIYAEPGYVLVHSVDPSKTQKYLENLLPNADEPYLYSPTYFYDRALSDGLRGIISSIISLAVMIAILSVCVYFIMRSALMSRIKEIGIYRAIGAKKGNIVFRFFIESLVLSTFTVLIGYIIGTFLIVYMENVSSVIGALFYYPFWMAAIVLLVLYAVCMICAVIPISLLLRKTPSEILSKYDI